MLRSAAMSWSCPAVGQRRPAASAGAAAGAGVSRHERAAGARTRGSGFLNRAVRQWICADGRALERVPFNANSIAEDVEYHTKLVARGAGLLDRRAFVHAHSPASSAAQATQEARWEGGRLRVASRATRRLDWRQYCAGSWRALETLADVWSLASVARHSGAAADAAFSLCTGCMSLRWYARRLRYCMCWRRRCWAANPCAIWRRWPARRCIWFGRHLITPMVLRQSRSRAEWARTKREAPQP